RQRAVTAAGIENALSPQFRCGESRVTKEISLSYLDALAPSAVEIVSKVRPLPSEAVGNRPRLAVEPVNENRYLIDDRELVSSLAGESIAGRERAAAGRTDGDV